MQCSFIQTKSYIQSVNDFLDTTSPINQRKRNTFKEVFGKDPYNETINTHALFQKNNNIIYSSYITKKIRFIRLLIKPNTILPYRIVTDHDYHKIHKTYPAILALSRFL